MAGIIRWRDLQNIITTENEINLLSGLIVNGPQINKLEGFTGNGSDLNNAVSTIAVINSHISKNLAAAHPLLSNSIDGGVLVNSTVSKAKLSFNALDSLDKLNIDNSIAQINTDLSQVETQVANLYTVLFPSVTGDIAQQFTQLVGHIEMLEDAHDSDSISFGNQYPFVSNALAGATQVTISSAHIKYFKVGDIVEFKDSQSGPETRTLIGVDADSGQIGWSSPLLEDYRVLNSAVVKNNSQANVFQALDRSLKNSTDVFSGRLTINQTNDRDALVVNKTGLGYSAKFNNFVGKTFADFSIELGQSNNTSHFSILDSQKREAFKVTDQGNVVATDYELLDRTSLNKGLVSKQSLTDNRNWTFPNRSGFIGIGDLAFTELLKVSLISGTKQLKVAPGHGIDYTGQKIGAWISMDKPCEFNGATIDIQAKFIADNQVLTLGNQWQVFVVYVNTNDILNFFYGPKEATKEEAIAEYFNFIPSAFMKLAKVIVQGDGAGGILQSSIEILEDQRPFLTLGMSASYYDETLSSPTGWSAGTLITLPTNSKAGGIVQTYKPGRGQIEVYLDGAYQVSGVDYEETIGEPVGRIRTLKDIATNSTFHFRITFAAAAVTGGFDVPTLQTAYHAGPLVSISDLFGPIKLISFDTDVLMDIEGSINLTNKIYNLKKLIFQNSSLTEDLDKNQIYIDNNSELIFHQHKAGVSKDYNLINELDDAKTLTRMKMFNAAGVVIPKGKAVALHPSIPNAIVFCDTSNSLSMSRCIGITLENINIGEVGDVITSGLFKLTGLGISHNTVLVVDPRNPGMIVPKSSVNFLPTDEYMEVGVVDGGHLIVQLVYTPKAKSIWKVGVAGEAFAANETRLVRFAISGESRGRVYKADKANANLDQKFWVVAAICPSVPVEIGDAVELLKLVDLHVSENAFADQDIGMPLYLDSNGLFKPWRLLNGTFTVGDAAIKIGQIEDRRKFIIDGIQMMGTAPGPSFL
jgi:hypothetical protein